MNRYLRLDQVRRSSVLPQAIGLFNRTKRCVRPPSCGFQGAAEGPRLGFLFGFRVRGSVALVSISYTPRFRATPLHLSFSLSFRRQLLDLLKSFSANMVEKTKNLEEKMDDLACKTTVTKVLLNNTLNEFLMLANTQFIENRVYEDHDVDVDAEEAEAKAREEEEQRAASMDPAQVQARWKKALSAGMEALRFKVLAIFVSSFSCTFAVCLPTTPRRGQRPLIGPAFFLVPFDGSSTKTRWTTKRRIITTAKRCRSSSVRQLLMRAMTRAWACTCLGTMMASMARENVAPLVTTTAKVTLATGGQLFTRLRKEDQTETTKAAPTLAGFPRQFIG